MIYAINEYHWGTNKKIVAKEFFHGRRGLFLNNIIEKRFEW